MSINKHEKQKSYEAVIDGKAFIELGETSMEFLQTWVLDENLINEWVKENCIGELHYSERFSTRLYFDEESDMMAFKLRWI